MPGPPFPSPSIFAPTSAKLRDWAERGLLPELTVVVPAEPRPGDLELLIANYGDVVARSVRAKVTAAGFEQVLGDIQVGHPRPIGELTILESSTYHIYVRYITRLGDELEEEFSVFVNLDARQANEVRLLKRSLVESNAILLDKKEVDDWQPTPETIARVLAAGQVTTIGTRLSDSATEVMRHLSTEYVKAGYPNFKAWNFTPENQDDPTMGELRALGLLRFAGPRGGPWYLTEAGLDWVMCNRTRPDPT